MLRRTHMKKIRNFYFLRALIILCVTFCLSYAGYDALTDQYAKETRNNVIVMKKSMLKSTVDNLVYALKNQEKLIRKAHPQWTNKQVKTQLSKDLRQRIYSSKYDFGSYLWVNEVKNYHGGKNYAVRLVHNEYPETEGQYLSTYTKDSKGNTPYLTELNGVKKNGSFFYTYYFYYKNEKTPTHKLTYATLYKKYNWIICMGISLNDVSTYANRLRKKYDKYAFMIIIGIELTITLIFIASYLFEDRRKKKYYKSRENVLRTQLDYDYLTHVYTRSYGESFIAAALLETPRVNSAVAMFDIDDFKFYNDTYGHNIGDEVLRQISETIHSVIRSTDVIFRYGGDEFICFFYNVNLVEAEIVAHKIIESIRSLKIQVEDQKIKASISLGLTLLRAEDHSVDEVIARADQALYLAKQEGKDCIKFI